MYLKHLTIALMAAFVYEVFLKTFHLLLPSLFHAALVSGLTSLLSFVVAAIIFLFLLAFYGEEKNKPGIGGVLKLLIACFILHTLLRLPVVRQLSGFDAARLAGEIVSILQTVLVFAALLLYYRRLSPAEKSLRQATRFVTGLSGAGIITGFYSLFTYLRFMVTGIPVIFSPFFYRIMFLLFLLTHAAVIYFLYRYYRFKFPGEFRLRKAT